MIIIKDEAGNAGSHSITIYPHLGETIDDYTSSSPLELNVSWVSITLIKNGAGSWFIISKVH